MKKRDTAAEFEGQPKFEQLVRTAKALFYKYGMKRVTVEEICEKSGVSKMTFYKYFSNKGDMSGFILNRMFDEGEAEYRAIMDQDIPFKEKAKQILSMKTRQLEDMSSEFMTEVLTNVDPEIAELYKHRRQHVMMNTIEDFKRAQKDGQMREDIKPQLMLYLLNRFTEMVQDPALLQFYDEPRDLVAELNRFFFYGILTHEE